MACPSFLVSSIVNVNDTFVVCGRWLPFYSWQHSFRSTHAVCIHRRANGRTVCATFVREDILQSLHMVRRIGEVNLDKVAGRDVNSLAIFALSEKRREIFA